MEFFSDNNHKYDYLFKIVIAGDEQTGKTTLINRLKADCFEEFIKNTNYIPTIGVEFLIKTAKYNNNIFKIQIWDTSGNESFSDKIDYYSKGCVAILLFYNGLNKSSFEKAISIYQRIKEGYKKHGLFIFVRSKYDMKFDETDNNKNNVISDDDVLQFIDNNNLNKNLFFAHLSSYQKNESGIDKIFTVILSQFLKNEKNVFNF